MENPNDYSIGTNVWITNFLWGEGMRCDQNVRNIRRIGAGGTIKLTCTAFGGGERNVELGGTTADKSKGAFGSQWGLRVLSGTHHFRCLHGCGVREDWECGSSGPCAVNVTITLNKKPGPPACPYTCQSWNPASKSCIGPAMNSCNRER